MKPTRSGGAGPRNGRVRVMGKMQTVRRPVLKDGQVECLVCRRGVFPLDDLRVRRHRDLFGDHCANTSRGNKPDVDLEAALEWVDQQVREIALAKAEKERVQAESAKYVRRVCTGRCHVCDRPITGERRYCGPCMANRL